MGWSRIFAAFGVSALLAAGSIAGAASAETSAAVTQARALPNGLEVSVGGAVWQITAIREDILRVRIGPGGHLPEDASWAVLPVARTHTASVQRFSDDQAIGFGTGQISVRLDRASGRLIIAGRDGREFLADAPERAVTLDAHGFALRKVLGASEHIFGLGDKAGPLDHRGQAYSLWNTDAFGWQESSDPLYKSIPFFIGADDAGRSFGLLLDNTWRSWFDFGRTDPRILSMGAVDGPVDYYVIAGPDPKAVVEAYAWLTGPSPMPPRWALGFQQSRYSYMDDAEVRGIAARLRAERIPADALYLDIDYQDRNRPFTVNKTAFPDLPALTRDLGKDGFHLVAITDLHIAHAPGEGYAPYDSGVAGDHFVKTPTGETYVGEVWPGPTVFPDFTRADTRAWWGGLYRDFVADGVAGFWNDMNEPAVFKTPTHSMPVEMVDRISEPGLAPRTTTQAEIHNIFGMQNSRATYEGLLAIQPDERPFVLTRASFAGGQRYAATWTGDNDSTWNHLKLSIPMIENLGLSGFAWSGADVGGYAASPSPELLTRWIEVAAFTPLFRDHSGKGTARHEPWVDGPKHTAMRRRFIEERYRLMPYIYALADETARTGLPVMRPLFLEFPAAAAFTRETSGEFLLGPDLLVAAQPEADTLDAWDAVLPGAGWFDYWTGLPVAAGGPVPGAQMVHEIPALGRLPVFARAGSIIPREPLTQSTAQIPDGPLELAVYPGPDCHGFLYDDDGHSRARERGDVLRQSVRCEQTGSGLKVIFEARQGTHAPWWKSLEVTVHGWNGPAPLARLDGVAVASRLDSAAQALHVTLPDQAGPAVLTLQ